MPFSHSSATQAQVQDLPILQERYALRRRMADSALGKLYWAQDLKMTEAAARNSVLVFTVLPELSQNPLFEQILGHILPSYQKPSLGKPQVIDDGKTADGLRWLVMRNVSGMLLSERLQELDERGMPFAEAMTLLESIAAAVDYQQPEGVFGYLEPNTILLGEQPPCLLTAPVAAALRAVHQRSAADKARQTLHSGYISPEVLLGDTPTSEDDSFSLAAIAYHLLQGEAPFGKHSSLEATVRNLAPRSIRKLRNDAWHVLQQGLSTKRANRPKNPTTFLQMLQRKQQAKRFIPIAALGITIAVALGTYSWLASDTPATQPNDISSAVPSKAAPRPDTHSSAGNPSTNVATLLEKAAIALRKGKILTSNNAEPSAVDYLRQVATQDPDHPDLKKLLAQIMDAQHRDAETLLSAGNAEEAHKLLSVTNNLISEFTFADALKRQVTLETAVEEARRKTALATGNDTATTPDAATSSLAVTTATSPTAQATPETLVALEQARKAIEYGNLTTGDERSESAVAYLAPLLAQNPKDSEALKLMKDIAIAQQEKAKKLMEKREVEPARAALNDTQKLISEYRLDHLVQNQISLEKRYRDTVEIVALEAKKAAEEAAANDLPPGISRSFDANAIIPENPAVRVVRPMPQPEPAGENPEAAETNAIRAVEARVSPDLPVQSATAPRPTPVAPPVVQPRPVAVTPPPVAQSRPVPAPVQPAPTTFVPDVPDLMEVPLDVIKEGLQNNE